VTRRSFLALVGVTALFRPVTAQANTKITLVGRLFRFHPDSDSLNYALDPTGDSEGLELKPLDGGYLSDYMKGCEGRIVNVTIEPQAE
jgi:hypothetical protein